MGAFFIYILKSAISLALFYLFFRLLLSRETFHRFNRIALLGILCLSWIIPWVEVTIQPEIEVNQVMMTVEQLLLMVESPIVFTQAGVSEPEVSPISWVQILLLVYWAGILFFVCRNIYSLGSLIKLLLSGKRQKLEKGITLIIHEKPIAPFSWMKYIVISRTDLEENGREILIHELAHIRNRHSIDLLVADICIFFQWFNPGAWLLKQELQNIHEYEADETVIKEGVNAKEYQLLLIKKAVGTRLYSMANSFNHSTLKKRITMMLKEKSNPWARFKYLYVIPLAAVALTAFARPEVSETVEEISAVKVNDLAAIVETSVDKISKGIPKEPKVEKLPSRSLVSSSSDSLKNAKDTVTKIGYRYMLTCDISDKKDLIIIDDKEAVGDDPLSKISQDIIESISILKDKKALEVYGKRGKAGAILISTKKTLTVQGKQKNRRTSASNRVEISKDNSGKSTLIEGVIDWQPETAPLFIVDNEEISYVEFSKIPQIRTDFVSMLINDDATSAYGEKGKNGVLVFKSLTDEEYVARKYALEKSPRATAASMVVANLAGSTGKMVFIVDGKEVSQEKLRSIPAKDVQEFVVSDGDYGKKTFNFKTGK